MLLKHLLRLFHLQYFHHNSNVMEISYCSHLNFNQPIAPSFFTCHDSCAVMACAKSWSDIITKNWITVKRNFHQIWFVMEQALVKGIPQLMMKCGSLIEWYSCNMTQIIYGKLLPSNVMSVSCVMKLWSLTPITGSSLLAVVYIIFIYMCYIYNWHVIISRFRFSMLILKAIIQKHRQGW